MAALYLHNAIFIPTISETPLGHSPHSRTISSGTLRTIATTNSHPTEPLLNDSSAYQDMLSRQPSHPSRHSDWEASLSFDGDPTTVRERKGFWEQTIRRKLRLLKIGQVVLEIVMTIWAVYNTVRYFLAYNIYSSMEGQSVSLVLGTLTALAFAFFSCAAALSALEAPLVVHHIPIRSVLIMGTAFRSIASFFLIVPAIVNLALTIVWRTSADPELTLRCHLDIDIVWSVVHESCRPIGWGFGLGAAILRTIITSFIIVAHYSFSSAYRATRRPSLRRRSQYRRHRRPRSTATQSLDGTTLTSPPMTVSSKLPVSIPPRVQASSNPNLRHTSGYRNSRPSSFVNAPSSPGTSRTSGSPVPSDDESSTDMSDTAPAIITTQNLPQNFASSSTGSDRELQGFVDRFRSLVSQISRETEDALVYAIPNYNDGNARYPDDGDIYTALPPRRLGYDEFGQPYPPDGSVRILNTFVRRMPTIESLGSREMTPSIASSTHQLPSVHSISRPPTRANTLGSEGPSRQSSIGRSAGGITGISEATEFGTLADDTMKISENSMWGPTPARRSGSIRSARSTGSRSVTGSSGRTRSSNNSASYHAATGSGASAPNSSHSGPPTPHSECGHPLTRPSSSLEISHRSESPSSSLEGEIDHRQDSWS